MILLIILIFIFIILEFKVKKKETFITEEESKPVLKKLPITGIFHIESETKLEIPKYYNEKCNDQYLNEYSDNYQKFSSIYNNSPYDSA